MIEFKNIIIPNDVYHLILPYINCKIDECTKEEFLKLYDKTFIDLKQKVQNNKDFYNKIKLGNNYPDNIYYLVLSYVNGDEKVCTMTHQRFIEIFDKAFKELRKDIYSMDEYYDLLESNSK